MRLNYARIADIVEMANNYIPDTSELTPRDLRIMMDMPPHDAHVASAIVNRSGYHDLPEAPDQCKQFVNMIQEALHQDLDGWDKDEQMIIHHFLIDIVFACSQEDGWKGSHNKVYAQPVEKEQQ